MCRSRCCAANSDATKYGMIPSGERKCRDVLCCGMFALFWVGMIVIAGIAFENGNPARLLYGTDYQGNTCGTGDFKDMKYITYPRTTEDFLINAGKSPDDMKFYGICRSSCPKQYDIICNLNAEVAALQSSDPDNYNNTRLLAYLNGTTAFPGNEALIRANCWVTPVDTESTLFHCLPVQDYDQDSVTACIFPASPTMASTDTRCIVAKEDTTGTQEKPAHQNYLFDAMSTSRASWSRYFGDIQRTWYVIVICGVLLAVLVAFLWLLIMKYFTMLMVILAIVLTISICLAMTLFCYFKAGILDADSVQSFTDQVGTKYSTKVQNSLTASEENKTRFRIAAFAFTGITIIVICVVVVLRRSIMTAVNVIKLGVRAISNVPGTLMYPVFTVVLLFSLLVWWVFVAAAMASAGDVKAYDFNITTPGAPASANSTFYAIDGDRVMKYFLIYHFFGLLWTNQFIQGFGICVIAGATCGWYFSTNDAGSPDADKYSYTQPRFPVLSAMWRTFRYHMGSIAFGSLLIAVIQFIRAVMAYLQRHSKAMQEGNRLVKAMFCCVQCCLKCLQTLVEVFTRNAFIFIAMKGYSFCDAGRDVFKLLFANAMTLAIVNYLSEIITFLGKIFVAAASGFFCFWYVERTAKFQEGGSDAVSSSWLPVIITMLFAYCVASGFFYVYDVAVDSMLVCFLVDADENMARHNGDSAHKIPIHVKKDMISSLEAKSEAPNKQEPVTVAPLAAPSGGGYGEAVAPATFTSPMYHGGKQ